MRDKITGLHVFFEVLFLDLESSQYILLRLAVLLLPLLGVEDGASGTTERVNLDLYLIFSSYPLLLLGIYNRKMLV
jgi:hypothetical protein